MDVKAPFGWLGHLEQLVLINCPQASLLLYEPEYLGSSSTEALNEEGSNLLSGLEQRHDEHGGGDKMMWMGSQQELNRPILFIAHSFGGLVVEKVCTVSL